MWKYFLRCISFLFAVSVIWYLWACHEGPSDWLTIFTISIGCLLLVLFSFLDWPAIFVMVAILLVPIWNEAENTWKDQRREIQSLLPYSKRACTACQALLQKDAHYCMRCGFPVDKQYCVRFCPVCQHTMPLDANFCPRCRYGMAVFLPEMPSMRRKAIRPLKLEELPTKEMKVTQPLTEQDDAWDQLEQMAAGKLSCKPVIS